MQSIAEINALLLQIQSEFEAADNDIEIIENWSILFNLEDHIITIGLPLHTFTLQVKSAEVWPDGAEISVPEAMKVVSLESSLITEMTIEAKTAEHEDCEYLRFHFVRLEAEDVIYAFEITSVEVSTK